MKRASMHFNAFDMAGEPTPTMLQSWGYNLVTCLIVGMAMSPAFVTVAKFPPAGYRGSTVLDNVLCCLGQAINIIPSAHVFVSYRANLSDSYYWAYYTVGALIVFVGLRTLFEEATGRSPDLLPMYLLMVILIYPGLLPIGQGLVRQAEPPANKVWHSPWKWTISTLKAVPFSEFKFVVFGLPAAFLYIAYTVLDAYVFLNPKQPIDETTRTVLRPLVSVIVRRLSYMLFGLGFGFSESGELQLYGLVTIHIILTLVNVRLATSCTSVNDLLVVLVVDWFVYFGRTGTYWLATAPAAQKEKYMACTKRFIRFQTWDKIKFVLGQGGAVPLHDFRAFEFLIENAALTTCYCTVIIGFGWHKLLGLGSSDPAHAFWYPLGTSSLYYTLVAFGNDLIQDLSAHVVVHMASHRHTKFSNFTAIWPGWLKRPKHGLLYALKAAGTCLWEIGILTQFGFFLVQEGFIESGDAGSNTTAAFA